MDGLTLGNYRRVRVRANHGEKLLFKPTIKEVFGLEVDATKADTLLHFGAAEPKEEWRLKDVKRNTVKYLYEHPRRPALRIARTTRHARHTTHDTPRALLVSKVHDS